MSSPPRRGCFLSGRARRPHHSVFPASAGVFPEMPPFGSLSLCLPRLGGGVSEGAVLVPRRVESSPPRRGCFGQRRSWRRKRNVFPASAGVFPASAHKSRSRPGLPRLGGGVSTPVGAPHCTPQSSPPRRGCFRLCRPRIRSGGVFPASAGVFLTLSRSSREMQVFPASAGVFPPPCQRFISAPSLPRLGGGVSKS